MKAIILFTFLFFGHSMAFAKHDHKRHGLMPENNILIPANSKKSNSMTKARFDQAIQSVQTAMQPLLNALGTHVSIRNKWDSPIVNAYAAEGYVDMHGGMARHREMTFGGLLITLCHEFGHTLGMSPKYPGRKLSSEGQADYFATLDCMRRVYKSFPALLPQNVSGIPQLYQDHCRYNFYYDPTGLKICLASLKASVSMANVVHAVANPYFGYFSKPSLNKQDPSVVSSTVISTHPQAQCRLDTMARGALCSDQNVVRSQRYSTFGLYNFDFQAHCSTPQYGRPACWYKK